MESTIMERLESHQRVEICKSRFNMSSDRSADAWGWLSQRGHGSHGSHGIDHETRGPA